MKNILDLQNEDGETVLHTATKNANKEAVAFLIKLGADLAAQDKTGNTPLHDLLDRAAGDEANIDEYINIWKVVVQHIVFWWCFKFGLKCPYKSSKNYRHYRTDALYYLRSEIPNKDHLSLIQLAANKGLLKRFILTT